MNILIINGPNINLLGSREPEIYQQHSYHDLVIFIEELAKLHCVSISMQQTNHEGTIIDLLHNAINEHIDGIIINPGAYTHYSYAIYDAIKAINIPTVEVHLTDITKRESWRSMSVIKDVCVKTYMGEHFKSYQKAIEYFIQERG